MVLPQCSSSYAKISCRDLQIFQEIWRITEMDVERCVPELVLASLEPRSDALQVCQEILGDDQLEGASDEDLGEWRCL
jgi:hypothetical protein